MKTEDRPSRESASLFLQIADDLPAVLTVGTVADVNPIHAALVVLPDELVKGQVVLYIVEPRLALALVAFDVNVCRLALQVLRVAHAAYRRIEGNGAECAADADRLRNSIAQWLQYMVYQRAEAAHLLRVRSVLYSLGFRRRAGGQFLQREVLTDYCHGHRLLSVSVVLVTAYLYMHVALGDMQLHACHEGTETEG